MKRWAEIVCEKCEDSVARVEIVPGVTLIWGQTFCYDCFDTNFEEDE